MPSGERKIAKRQFCFLGYNCHNFHMVKRVFYVYKYEELM